MMSAWKEPFGRDDHTDGQGAEPDENQLELFEILPRASIGTERPSAASLNEDAALRTVDMERSQVDSAITGAVGPSDVEMIVNPAATRDVLDVGGPDSDDLRRLEESIRWLTNAGTMTMPLPRTAPLPPVIGLPPVDAHEDDSLLLDPDTLFTPRPPRRRSGIAAGAAKIILVSAVAAPAAYFVASWSQFPGAAAPSDPAAIPAVATPVAMSGEQVAARGAVPLGPTPQAARNDDEVSKALQPEPAVSRAVEVAAAPVTTEPTAAPEQPPGGAAAPADAASPPVSVVMPSRPSLRPEEIAMMIERGRVLFDAGDLAAARLFFRRAANAGDPAAAIAMGSTYDPEVLSQRFVGRMEADAKEAQKWYEKAREMETHVEMLAHNR